MSPPCGGVTTTTATVTAAYTSRRPEPREKLQLGSVPQITKEQPKCPFHSLQPDASQPVQSAQARWPARCCSVPPPRPTLPRRYLRPPWSAWPMSAPPRPGTRPRTAAASVTAARASAGEAGAGVTEAGAGAGVTEAGAGEAGGTAAGGEPHPPRGTG